MKNIINPKAAIAKPAIKRSFLRSSSCHSSTFANILSFEATKRIIAKGRTNIKLYSIKSLNILQFNPIFAKIVVIAKYGPPVHGSSTAATKIPRRIAPGTEAFLTYFFMVFIQKPRAFQKFAVLVARALKRPAPSFVRAFIVLA